MFMYAVKKPAAAALGENGTAVFCEGPGLLLSSMMLRRATSTTATGGSPAPGASPRSSSICPRRWAKSSPAGSRAPCS